MTKAVPRVSAVLPLKQISEQLGYSPGFIDKPMILHLHPDLPDGSELPENVVHLLRGDFVWKVLLELSMD